jgi:hypothetical protein
MYLVPAVEMYRHLVKDYIEMDTTVQSSTARRDGIREQQWLTLAIRMFKCDTGEINYTLKQWDSVLFIRVPPDVIPLRLCAPKYVDT